MVEDQLVAVRILKIGLVTNAESTMSPRNSTPRGSSLRRAAATSSTRRAMPAVGLNSAMLLVASGLPALFAVRSRQGPIAWTDRLLEQAASAPLRSAEMR